MIVTAIDIGSISHWISSHEVCAIGTVYSESSKANHVKYKSRDRFDTLSNRPLRFVKMIPYIARVSRIIYVPSLSAFDSAWQHLMQGSPKALGFDAEYSAGRQIALLQFTSPHATVLLHIGRMFCK